MITILRLRQVNGSHRQNYIGARRLLIATAITLVCGTQTIQAQVPDTLIALRNNAAVTRMSLHVNGGFYIGGTYTGDDLVQPVVSDPGTRLLWFPEKAAFRAGMVTGTQWDNANIGNGSVALGEDNRASHPNSTALGLRCWAGQQSAFAIGEQSTATGAASVAMGYHAHTNARQGSFVFCDRSSVDTLRAGVNHSANWRTSGGFRIFTSSNLSTGVTLQSGASVSNWGQSSAVISTSTGALLTTGGVWQNASDINRKHDIQPIATADILQKISQLPISSWGYNTEDASIRHIGPMAQDFYASFGLGNDDKSIGTVDADGVALAGIQALEQRSREQAASLEQLAVENVALRKRLETLEQNTGRNQAGLPLTIALGGCALLLVVLTIRRNAQPSTK
ncbi:tail fiber domain-containing protein [Paraflavitalea pollutisoli]|uniref:tail fiber domain-containing protein n=1 Tax=Paraflavitalea pollutisoli TaxID=3034143 RepID=UPI0023ECBD74|nr:tail fiber domain-containing protein [Paraflavitalea sp. H1-2-19X]